MRSWVRKSIGLAVAGFVLGAVTVPLSYAQTQYRDDSGRFEVTVPAGAKLDGKMATLTARGASAEAYCWPSKFLIGGAPPNATQADLNAYVGGFVESRQMPDVTHLSTGTSELQGVKIVETTWSLVVDGQPARNARRTFALRSSVGVFVGELNCGYSVVDEAAFRSQIDGYLSSLRFLPG